jgi:hypothetical protein
MMINGLGRYGKPYGWQDGQVVRLREVAKYLVAKGEERTVVSVWEALS